MKRSIVAIVVCVAFACQEVKEDFKTSMSEIDSYKRIGQEIPFETGMEWIEYYRLTEYHKKKNAGNAKLESESSYNVLASALTALLQSTPNLIGIAFHYGLDNIGEKHIILIPIDGTFSVWSSSAPRIFIDANTGNSISQVQAYMWTQKYQNAHPNEVFFHFFGSNIFTDITTIPFFNSFDIQPAINVLDLTPQLLLIIWNEDLLSTGRTSGEYAIVYDASNACPPCAVQ